MKAPINFAQKIKGHEIRVGRLRYVLGDTNGSNDELWIYPQWNSNNVMNIYFDWKKENYVVRLAKNGDGMNFHTTLPAFAFVRTTQFKSFASFNSWMIAKIDDLYHHFEYRK